MSDEEEGEPLDEEVIAPLKQLPSKEEEEERMKYLRRLVELEKLEEEAKKQKETKHVRWKSDITNPAQIYEEYFKTTEQNIPSVKQEKETESSFTGTVIEHNISPVDQNQTVQEPKKVSLFKQMRQKKL